MRVLLLAQVAPSPPDAGPKAKTHYVLRTLSQQHEVDLITFVRDDTETENARTLSSVCSSITTIPLKRSKVREPYYAANGWARMQPFLVARDQRTAFSRAVVNRVKRGDVDVIHADQLSMGQYMIGAGPGRSQRIFDAHNAVWELVRALAPRQPTPAHRAAAEIEWRLLKRFEGRLCRQSDLTFTVSQRDLDSLTDAARVGFPSAVVPIGVEVSEIPFEPPPPNASGILSVATMHYPPNADAIRWYRDEIWPLVKQSADSCTTTIVGPRPPSDLVEWGAADDHVAVTGYVKELDDVYRAAGVFIVPLTSGSGVRVKILDAMARGVPVVSTSIGADGLDLEPGRHLMIADSPTEFARAVLDLLAQPGQRYAIAQAARERVLERYDWRVCCAPVLDAYDRLSLAQPSALRVLAGT